MEDGVSCNLDCAICGDNKCGTSELVDGPNPCLTDCPVCGDSICTPPLEWQNKCPADCACDDGVCDLYEAGNVTPCLQDCAVCGNGVCELPKECDIMAGCACADCYCGDGICAADESFQNCPLDCGVCGDGACTASESYWNCTQAQDCGNPEQCADGWCSVYEDAKIYPVDCPVCPNQVCEPGETPTDCAQDCPGAYGDGFCNLFAESGKNCPGDCASKCGDSLCEVAKGETPSNCPDDCVHCLDGTCAGPAEVNKCKTLLGLAPDCILAACGDGWCSLGESAASCPECAVNGDGKCTAGESPKTAFADCCGACGDGKCLGYQCAENPKSCPADCGTACGDGVCGKGEWPASCPPDCKTSTCGDGACTASDGGPVYCPDDCAAPCGDGICNMGESWQTCRVDCGYCGDGVCIGIHLGLLAQYLKTGTKSECGDGICGIDLQDVTSLESFGAAVAKAEILTCSSDCSGVPAIAELGDCPEDCSPDKCPACLGTFDPETCPGFCDGTPKCPGKACCGDPICPSGDIGTANCVLGCKKAVCGDKYCSVHESKQSCPPDCENECGDGKCDPRDLKDGCDADCGFDFGLKKTIVTCGDGMCNHTGEMPANCPKDCKAAGAPAIVVKPPKDKCSDGNCVAPEDPQTCWQDCVPKGGPDGPTCSDGLCDRDEHPDAVSTLFAVVLEPLTGNLSPQVMCPSDCCTFATDAGCADGASVCGNGTCEQGEDAADNGGVKTKSRCPKDCGPTCGNGDCQTFEGDMSGPMDMECASDCWPPCGDDKCAKGEELLCSADCITPVVCGDGICSAAFESVATCWRDCGPPCGDNVCAKGEDPAHCPWDCGYCGDAVCNPNERITLPVIGTIPLCALDCTPACGNGLCEKAETKVKCKMDCDSAGAK